MTDYDQELREGKITSLADLWVHFEMAPTNGDNLQGEYSIIVTGPDTEWFALAKDGRLIGDVCNWQNRIMRALAHEQNLLRGRPFPQAGAWYRSKTFGIENGRLGWILATVEALMVCLIVLTRGH